MSALHILLPLVEDLSSRRMLMRKLVDTNILLDYPTIVLEQTDLVIHTSVLDELDRLKTDRDKGFKARAALRILKDNQGMYDFAADEVSGVTYVDDILIEVAQKHGYRILTNDFNLQLKSSAKGIMSEGYVAAALDIDKLPYITHIVTEEELAGIYETGISPISMKENQFLICQLGSDHVDTFIYQDGSLHSFYQKPCSIETDLMGHISPRNLEQSLAIYLLKDNHAKLKLIRGSYGSGKDYLMLAQALADLQREKFKKIIYIRPNVGVRDVPDIGYLPGTINDKLEWTFGPLMDKIDPVGVEMLVSQGKLELAPLTFIRGRSFEDSLIYVSEGQNITKEIAKLLIGRIGERSEMWINADNHQTDKRIFDKDNGITAMVHKLFGNPLFGYVYLPKTERSAVAQLADLLDD